MPRSTQADKARQLNAAHRLLGRNVALAEAAQTLSRKFGLSLRQTYRYLEEAAQLEAPVEVTEATVPITLKLPPSTIRLLRTHARSSAVDYRSDCDTCAGRFFRRAKTAWLSGVQAVPHLKSIWTTRVIDCASRSSRKPTTFWYLAGNA